MKQGGADLAAARRRRAPTWGLYNPGVPIRHAMLLLLLGWGAGSAAADAPVAGTGTGPTAGTGLGH